MTKTDRAPHILVVEDSDTQAVMLRRILEGSGYRATIARNGAEGLSFTGGGDRPALIISDILMPVMDGYVMCAEIKKNANIRDIPVILLTQLTESEDVLKGLECGAENYVSKPYNSHYLLAKVAALLEAAGSVKNRPEKKCTEVIYSGKRYMVRSTREQTLNFLLSTYENAVYQYHELTNMQEENKKKNEELEELVKLRTASLNSEITERKSAEEALRESEERLRSIVETASDAVICLEPPDNIYMWNKKAEEIFGYSAAEALGKRLHELIIPERQRTAAREGLQVFVKNGTGNIIGRTFETEGRRKDGVEVPVELSISAVNLHGAWNSVGIIRDITERRRLESEMKQNLDDLKRMNRIMVGRELKMEELRREIRELRGRLKEPKARNGIKGNVK